MADPFDVIVIGGRCAGSPLAMLLARRGLRVLVVDRASFPSDTLSGHNIQLAGTAALARWGLYDRVAATGCPPISHYYASYGELELRGSPPVANAGDPPAALCVRRTMLDRLLVDAAVAAGAEVRESFPVTELLRDGDRVIGVRGASGACERARVVVGADGMRSFVARAVGAKPYRNTPPLTFVYYSYWQDLDPRPGAGTGLVEGEGWWGYRTGEGKAAGSGRLILVLPTNGGATAVTLILPADEFASFKGDVEANFLRHVDQTPLGERLRAARRVERFYGTCDVPNFFRRSAGPGWALVGDAGFFKDPLVGHGIADAFVWSEVLAEQIATGLAGGDLDTALSAYASRRDRDAGHGFGLTVIAARLQPITPATAPLMRALAADSIEAGRYFGALLAQSVDPRELFALDNIRRITGAAGGPG